MVVKSVTQPNAQGGKGSNPIMELGEIYIYFIKYGKIWNIISLE